MLPPPINSTKIGDIVIIDIVDSGASNTLREGSPNNETFDGC